MFFQNIPNSLQVSIIHSIIHYEIEMNKEVKDIPLKFYFLCFFANFFPKKFKDNLHILMLILYLYSVNSSKGPV